MEEKTKRKKIESSEELKAKLKECQKIKNEYLAGWQRARADFLNYKKQEIGRVSELLQYANEGLIINMLPILDNLDIAEKNLPEELKNDENPKGEPSVPHGASVKGFLQIKRQLENFLKSQGVEEIKSVGEKFDPNFQEIVEVVNKEGVEPGIIIEEIQKGYKLHGKVIRPARVKISK